MPITISNAQLSLQQKLRRLDELHHQSVRAALAGPPNGPEDGWIASGARYSQLLSEIYHRPQAETTHRDTP